MRIPGDADSTAPSISADGFTVAYSSLASNLDLSDTNGLADIYTYNHDIRVLSRRTTGSGGSLPNGSSTEPSINSDGTLIAFSSGASNLIDGDGNGVGDVFTVDSSGVKS